MVFAGVFTNVAAVVGGSLIGLAVGDRLPEKTKTAILSAIGLGTLGIGMDLILKTHSMILIIGSLLIGGLLGTALNVDGRLDALAERLKRAVASDSGSFVAAFVSTSLLFCVGPLTITGSIQCGASGDSTLLYIKSLLDGFVSIALASTLGIGVMFAALTVLVVQGGWACLGMAMGDLSTSRTLLEMNAVGGLLILGIGFDLLNIRKLPLANMLPALAVVIPLTMLAEKLAK